MAIYTRLGDNGITHLINSKKRISKNNIYLQIIGALDEANSYLGVAKMDYKKGDGMYKKLEKIQKDLMLMSSIIAGAKLEFPKNRVSEFEKEIDKLEKNLPTLTHFIIPKGHLMYARALVRRVEREVVELKRVNPEIIKYLNRLSDYLFVESRSNIGINGRDKV